MLEKGGYDLGIVVDPDVDRLALVCENGEMFGEEYTLVAVADYVLKQSGGGNTVSNLSSTRALRDVTERLGGNYAAAAVGEVNVVTKMKETNAIIGGEGNGGIILPRAALRPRRVGWYCFVFDALGQVGPDDDAVAGFLSQLLYLQEQD